MTEEKFGYDDLWEIRMCTTCESIFAYFLFGYGVLPDIYNVVVFHKSGHKSAEFASLLAEVSGNEVQGARGVESE